LPLGVWHGKFFAGAPVEPEVIRDEINAFQEQAKTFGGLRVRQVDQS